MTADYLAARLLGALLSLKVRWFPHQRPKVYEVSSRRVASLARERGWCKRERWTITDNAGICRAGDTLLVEFTYPDEFGSKGERAS